MIARINAAVAAAVGFATGTAASRAADDDFNIQNYFHSCTGEYADLSRGVGKDIVTRAHLKYEPTHPLFYEPFNATLTFTTDHDIDAKQLRIVFDVNFLKEFHYDWNIADYLDEEQCMMHLGTLPYEIALAKKDGRCTILKGSYTYTFEVGDKVSWIITLNLFSKIYVEPIKQFILKQIIFWEGLRNISSINYKWFLSQF